MTWVREPESVHDLANSCEVMAEGAPAERTEEIT